MSVAARTIKANVGGVNLMSDSWLLAAKHPAPSGGEIGLQRRRQQRHFSFRFTRHQCTWAGLKQQRVIGLKSAVLTDALVDDATYPGNYRLRATCGTPGLLKLARLALLTRSRSVS